MREGSECYRLPTAPMFGMPKAKGSVCRANALQWAAFHGDDAIVKELLAARWEVDALATRKNRCEKTALGLAAEQGHEKVVKACLAAGAAISCYEGRKKGLRWYSSDPPIHYARSLAVVGWVAEEALRRAKKPKKKGRKRRAAAG